MPSQSFAVRWRMWLFYFFVRAQRYIPFSPRLTLVPAKDEYDSAATGAVSRVTAPLQYRLRRRRNRRLHVGRGYRDATLREQPGLRVLIVEKSEQFSRRVGEATVEVSAYFMGRVLGLTQYLNEHHLVKQGLRFWFANDEVQNLGEASELGGRYQVRLPSYQLDRATFDEEVLRRAALPAPKFCGRQRSPKWSFLPAADRL